jgi:hypothetical protein
VTAAVATAVLGGEAAQGVPARGGPQDAHGVEDTLTEDDLEAEEEETEIEAEVDIAEGGSTQI